MLTGCSYCLHTGCAQSPTIFHKSVIRFCCSRVESHAHAVTGEAEAESEEEDRVAVVHVAAEEEIAELGIKKYYALPLISLD